MVDSTRLELVAFSMSRRRSNQTELRVQIKNYSMGGEGVEPSQPYGHRILSPACIPIPPPAPKQPCECAPTTAFLSVSTTRPDKNVTDGAQPLPFSVFPPPAPDHPETIINMEAWSGIEPLNSGFADHCLTTWLPRRRSLARKIRPLRASINVLKRPSRCLQCPPNARHRRYRRPICLSQDQ
jgi:hypothetical protein